MTLMRPEDSSRMDQADLESAEYNESNGETSLSSDLTYLNKNDNPSSYFVKKLEFGENGGISNLTVKLVRTSDLLHTWANIF